MNHNILHQLLVVGFLVAGVLIKDVQLSIQLTEDETVVELTNHLHF